MRGNAGPLCTWSFGPLAAVPSQKESLPPSLPASLPPSLPIIRGVQRALSTTGTGDPDAETAAMGLPVAGEDRAENGHQ